MFIEMKKQRFDFTFGTAKLWLRYDIGAFYNIEESGYSPFDIISQSNDPKAVRCFLENGLADWYESIDDTNGIDEYVNSLMSAEGYQTELLTLMQSAVLLALPQGRIGNKREKPDSSGNILNLMTAFVDVMGASKEEFIHSTMREASERWERYAVAMGYIKPAEKFRRYDDDD